MFTKKSQHNTTYLKALLCTMCAAALLLTFTYRADAAGTAAISVGQASARPGQRVTVPVRLEANPGIAGLLLTVEFDAARLTVESASAITQGAALSTHTFIEPYENALIQNAFRVLWFGASNCASTGTLIYIEFSVNSSASIGNAAVTVSAGIYDIINQDEAPVPLSISQGGVNVIADGTPGDTPIVTPGDPDDNNDQNETNIIQPGDANQVGDEFEPYYSITREAEIRDRLSVVAPIYVAFYDVSQEAWYYNAINFVAARGLFEGVGDNRFAPAQTMTRAMFITVLSRIDGIDAQSYTISPFTDVDINTWYGPAIIWAHQAGIIDSGILYAVPAGEFRPDENITREQMAVIFANYLNFRDFGISETPATEFYDIAEASPWAREPIQAMRTFQIIQGIGGNRYNPLGDATRAEVSQIFMNLVNAIVG